VVTNVRLILPPLVERTVLNMAPLKDAKRAAKYVGREEEGHNITSYELRRVWGASGAGN
jgi:hypothetical protein